MDILGTLLGTGASAVSGGLFGLAGNLATKVFSFFENRQSFAQKRAEWVHETELLKLQMQAKTQETEHEEQITAMQGRWAGLRESVAAQGAIGSSYKWVDAVRALVRPVLTLGLAVFLAVAFLVMTPGDIDRAYIADSLVFAAVTAIVWWFGDRAPKRAPR